VRSFGIVVALLLAATSARAQEVATSPAPARNPHPPSGIGATLGIGRAGDGWLARLDQDMLVGRTPDGQIGPVFGFQTGFEFWRHAPDWGFGLPVAAVMGVRVFPLRATLGLGLEAAFIDSVADDTGFGMWAPFVSANLGFDIHGFRLGVDSRVIRRWQLGADDFTQWQLALYVGGDVGARPPSAWTPAR
jgi:hypothetical protein